jgi:hypothetical protein
MSEHRDEFDSFEPDPGHFGRFEQRLAAQPQTMRPLVNRSVMLRIAALVLVLISISVFLFEYAGKFIGERFAAGRAGTELPLEVREAVQYYENQAATRLGTLNALAANQKGTGNISESALSEIRTLDASTADLKKMLAASPGNEHILDAILRNQQMKESVLNNIISQVSQTK